MKKSFLLWMGVVLMMVINMSSCSSDDNFVTNHNDDKATEQTYYCYNEHGEKTPITLFENKVLVSVPLDCNLVIERIRANVQAFYSGADSYFYFSFMTRADLEKLTSLDFWEEDAKSVIITPSYIIDDDRGEFYQQVYLTPYLLVKLKKEEDIDLLTSYIEKYKLQINYHSTYFPLSYTLSVTLDSEKSPLECANEMFESGNFAWSVASKAYPASGASGAD